MERIKVDELKIKYEFEPTIRDIFVEGDSDACFINTFLNEIGIRDAKVYCIEFIDIPEEYLIENETNNNRGRVIALSRILGQEEYIEDNAICVIDRDFDKIRNINVESNILIYTDYSSIEMYTFNANVLDKFIVANFSKLSNKSSDILDNLCDVLQELFLIRLANEELELCMESLDFLKFCKIKENYTIDFDKDEYMKRYLLKNSELSRKDDFIESIETNRSKLDEDVRFQIHGHDFIKLLFWYFEKIKRRKLGYTEDTLWKVLSIICCNNKTLSEEKMFEHIVNKTKKCNLEEKKEIV